MNFRIRAYTHADGCCPAREFLEEHKHLNPKSHTFLIAGIRKLRSDKYHREPLSKAIGNDLYELRNVSSNARILFFFRPKQLIVLLLGLVKRGDKLSRTDINKALTYKADYLERCTTNEEEIDEEF